MSKVTEQMVEAACEAFMQPGFVPMRAALEAALSQCEAVALAAGISEFGVLECNLLPGGIEQLQSIGEGARLYLHPQPAPQSEPAAELSGLSAWWRNRAGPWDQVIKKNPENIAAATALYECADELEAALAATGKQSGSERERFEVWCGMPAHKDSLGDYVKLPVRLAWSAWQAATASRETVVAEQVANVRDTLPQDVLSAISGVAVIADKESGRAVKKYIDIINAWLYAAPPAQGVDLDPLRRLYKAYVRLLESGRDRIMDLGGTCDPVDQMERMDADLIEARNLLGIKIDQRDGEGE